MFLAVILYSYDQAAANEGRKRGNGLHNELSASSQESAVFSLGQLALALQKSLQRKFLKARGHGV